MSHKRLAVSVILGCNLSPLGPGASAAKSCMPPMPNKGKMAIASTIIPIPPIQFVVLRQNKIPWDNASTSFKIVDPVVVYPDMVSKKAFVKLGMLSVNIYGKVPDNDIIIQPNVTTIYPSRLLISFL